jgi:SAM-dependent methyltransferase
MTPDDGDGATPRLSRSHPPIDPISTPSIQESPSSLLSINNKVRAFYEECSFPGYEDFDSPQSLGEKAERGGYARLLGEQIPFGARVLDAGCGTGQLALYLSMVKASVVGIDFSFASLGKGQAFKRKFDLHDVRFVQMNLFDLGLRRESFDYVFSNGVLHHTGDAHGGFRGLTTLVKPGGYIVIGLYNTYGRLLLDLRRVIFRVTRGNLLWLDSLMRRRGIGAEKKRIWFLDQYRNPHEDKFTVDDVLGWFAQDGIDYVNAVPKIVPFARMAPDEKLFEAQPPGSRLEHLLAQLGWIVTKGAEGGFFLVIGRKRG